jgi:hypothetical protein
MHHEKIKGHPCHLCRHVKVRVGRLKDFWECGLDVDCFGEGVSRDSNASEWPCEHYERKARKQRPKKLTSDPAMTRALLLFVKQAKAAHDE